MEIINKFLIIFLIVFFSVLVGSVFIFFIYPLLIQEEFSDNTKILNSLDTNFVVPSSVSSIKDLNNFSDVVFVEPSEVDSNQEKYIPSLDVVLVESSELVPKVK